ncbi:MAG: hypothetical protein IKR19_08805 [Acholeplasmatales bacterium]|nr:hypothetical protein [Acholeplasmatales bacterium]
MKNDNARWLIYRCNICNLEIAKKLEDQYGDDIELSDAMIEVYLLENKIPPISWGISKCRCEDFGSIRPSYSLIGHCKEKDIFPNIIKDDRIRIRLRIPEEETKNYGDRCNKE